MNLITVQFVLLILGVACVLMGYHVLREYERAVIFRWGCLTRGRIRGNRPGVVIIIPFIDTMVRVSVRTVTIDVAPHNVITKDTVSVKVKRSFTSESWTRNEPLHVRRKRSANVAQK